MPNNLAVAVSADVTDLQVKFTVAKAETSALTSEMNKLAKQSAAGIIDPAGQARLQEVAGDFLQAKAAATELAAEVKRVSDESKQAGESFEGVGGALEEIRGKITSAFQITGIAAVTEAVNLARESIERLGERATQMRAMSTTLGVSVEQFQAMGLAASASGTTVEVFARASERLIGTLTSARDGSTEAITQLKNLGITTEQINDPTFELSDALAVLRERLENTQTSQSTMNELIREFGPRAALAANAIKEYDGSASGVATTLEGINALDKEQVGQLHDIAEWWGRVGVAATNTASKAILAADDMKTALSKASAASKDQGELMSGDPESQAQEIAQATSRAMAEAKEQAQEGADAQIEAMQTVASVHVEIEDVVTKDTLTAIKARESAEKEGTAARVASAREYYQAALEYYGSGTVEPVRQAYAAMQAADKSYNQEQKRGLEDLTRFSWESDNDILMDRLKLAAESSKITNDLVKDQDKQAKELYEGWQQTYTEITEKHAQQLKQQNADAARAAKEESKSWQGIVGEIEGAESSMVRNVLSGRKSLTQSLIQLSGDLVTKEISNDVRAMTTRLLLSKEADIQQKALEQGGLIYHEAVELAKTLHLKTQQTAQTGAVESGNIARNAATASAAAASQAAAAATGASTVMADAAKAYAGTFASVAQIPYVGYMLAPAAAEASFAAVSAYAGMASLDTGTNYVPRDMLAQIHEGEAVIPRQYNPAAGGSGGGYSEEHNYNGSIHVSAFDAQSMAKMLSRSGGRSAMVAGLTRAFRRGAR